MAEAYGDGTARLTCEENILFVNVPDASLAAMLAEPIFQKYKVHPGACVLVRAAAAGPDSMCAAQQHAS